MILKQRVGVKVEEKHGANGIAQTSERVHWETVELKEDKTEDDDEEEGC